MFDPKTSWRVQAFLWVLTWLELFIFGIIFIALLLMRKRLKRTAFITFGIVAAVVILGTRLLAL